jgi:hypothetical protein
MQYRLRTLLIVLAVGPLVIAGTWLNRAYFASGFSLTMLLAVAIGVSLYTVAGFGLFIAAVRLIESMAEIIGQKRR